MGKYKNATQGGGDAQKSTSLTPSSYRGEDIITGDAVQDLGDDVDSLKEGISWMGSSPIMPFRFMLSSQLPSKWSLMPECQQDHPIPEDQMCYCILVRVTFGEGGGNQPSPSHAWSGSLIVDMFQKGLKEQITKVVVLVPGKAILFLDNNHTSKGSPWEVSGM